MWPKLARQDTAALLGIAGIAALAWGYVVWLARAMDMTGVAPGADMSSMIMPAFGHWKASDAAFMFAMWAIMMIGMMMPSAAPMILLYNRIGAAARASSRAFAPSLWFACGYILAWIGFAAVATLCQWGLEQALLLTPAMSSASRF